MRRYAIGVFAAALLFAPAALGARSAAPSCTSISAATAKSLLGMPIVSGQKVATAGNAGLTLCWYGTSANPQAVQLAFRSPGKTQFATDEKTASTYAKSVSGLGDQAFYNSAGGPTHTSLYVLKGNVEVTILAFAPLAKTEALARKAVASL